METLQEALKARAAELRQQLIKKGAASVYVFYYSDMGDGGIEAVEVGAADGKVIKLDGILEGRLKNLFYDLLGARFEGWENGHGANGEFTWDLKTDRIRQEHNASFEDYSTTEVEYCLSETSSRAEAASAHGDPSDGNQRRRPNRRT